MKSFLRDNYPTFCRSLLTLPLLFPSTTALSSPQNHVERIRFWQQLGINNLGLPLSDKNLRFGSRISGLGGIITCLCFISGRYPKISLIGLESINCAITIANARTKKGWNKFRLVQGVLVALALLAYQVLSIRKITSPQNKKKISAPKTTSTN